MPGAVDKWLDRTLEIFSSIDTPLSPVPSQAKLPPPPSTMMLRERKPPANASGSGASTPKTSSRSPQKAKPAKPAESVDDVLKTLEKLDLGGVVNAESAAPATSTSEIQTQDASKKLPRVILR